MEGPGGLEELEAVAREDGVHVDRRIPIRGADLGDERLEDASWAC